MRVLVASAAGDGARPDDFNWCIAGELVHLPTPCAAQGDDNPDKCACSTTFAGMNSHQATTTARVVESQLTEAGLREAVRSSLLLGCWLALNLTDAQVNQAADDMVAALSRVTAHFPVGTIVRRRHWQVYTGVAPLTLSADTGKKRHDGC